MNASSPEGARLIAGMEGELKELSGALTTPRPRECLVCYVLRMLEYGCHGQYWLKRYRDLRAPRATALERRISRMGGYCDCEMLMNAFHPNPWGVRAGGDGDLAFESMPGCLGVRGGSTRPCLLWVDRNAVRWGQVPF